jgi:hypothetical protein
VTEPRAGWGKPRPDLIPASTPWPAAMALGIAFLGWGLITSPVVLGVGATLFVVSLAGWIGEIRAETRGGDSP